MKKLTMHDVHAVTPEQLTAMTPPQIDALNAVLGDEYNRIGHLMQRAWESLHRNVGDRRVPHGRSEVWELRQGELEEKARGIVASPPAEPPAELKRYDFMLTAEKYVEKIRTTLSQIDDLRDQVMRLDQGPHAKLVSEWDDRGGWSRFFLVNNRNGHIHKTNRNSECRTLHWDTDILWLPKLSGLTEKDAVKAHGTILCSVCFESAPVEWTVGKSTDDGRCEGSGKAVNLDARMARRRSKTATCPVCGQTGVSVTSTWKLRKHQPKK